MEIYNENKIITAGNVALHANIVVSLHPSAQVGSVVVTECWSYYDEYLENYLDAKRLNTVDVVRQVKTTSALLRDAIQAADHYFYLVRLIAEQADERLQQNETTTADHSATSAYFANSETGIGNETFGGE